MSEFRDNSSRNGNKSSLRAVPQKKLQGYRFRTNVTLENKYQYESNCFLIRYEAFDHFGRPLRNYVAVYEMEITQAEKERIRQLQFCIDLLQAEIDALGRR